MTMGPRYLPSLAVAVFCIASAPISQGFQAAATPAVAGVSKPVSPAAPPAAPLTEDALRSRYVGKMVFLRGAYMADDLNFSIDGKVNGSPKTTSFTLDALEIRKVHLSKRKLEMEADRYALHFTGALPYADESKGFEKVKISKKAVHITIERELVIIPKVKKEKAQKIASAKPALPAAKQPATGTVVAGTVTAPIPAAAPVIAAAPAVAAAPVVATAPVVALAPGTTTDPAHSAMLMNTALNNIFAVDLDSKMVAHMPDYWQEYFKAKNEHREFVPADTQVVQVGGDVSAPKVLNSIDPSSNEFAQKYGVAGLTLFRTVVDAQGKPQEIAIARPIGFGLDEKAVEAIKASRFKPATENGHPVPVVIDVVVTFRIYSNRTKPGSVTRKSKQTEVVASAWEDSNSGSTTPAP